MLDAIAGAAVFIGATLVVVGLAARLLGVRLGRRPYPKEIVPFVRHLSQRLELEGKIAKDLTRARLKGKLDGREARIDLDQRNVFFQVAASKAPPLRVSVDGVGAKLGLLFGKEKLRLTDRRYSNSLIVDTTEKDKTLEALQGGEGIRSAIVKAFARFGIEELEVKDGMLAARVPVAALRKKSDYEGLLRLLGRTAAAFDRVAIPVKVLGREGLAVVGDHGNARCAYCHDDLTGEEPDLTACEKCGTVIHEGCFAELGQCPVLGCTGTAPPREKVAEA